MAENDLQLKNVDGRIVALDPETGETRPVSLGDVDAGSVSTDQGSIKNYPTSVTISREGEDAVAVHRTDGEIARSNEHEKVFQAAVDSLSEGGEHQELISATGVFDFWDKVQVDDWTYLDHRGALLKVSENWEGGSGALFNWDDYEDESLRSRHVTVFGGSYYGNKENVSADVDAIRSGHYITDPNEDTRNAHNRVLYTQIWDFSGVGVRARDRRGLYQMVNVRNCDGTGIEVRSSDIQLRRCYSVENGVHGYDFYDSYNQWDRCIAEANNNNGIVVREGGNANEFHGGYSELNNSRGVWFVDAGPDQRIENMAFINNNRNDNDRPAIQVSSGRDHRISGNRFIQRDGETGNQETAIQIDSDASDVRLSDNNYDEGIVTPVDDNGTRTVQNGWGTNDGDPSSAGDWNGEGRDGIMVRDTTNGSNYAFVGGSWVAL